MNSFQFSSSRRSSQGSRRGSRDNLSEEEYAYVRHKAIPLDQLEKDSGRGSLVPDSCFQWKDVAIVEDDEEDPYPINSETERRCYLSSKRLLYFFGNQFYDLARTIGKGNLTSSAKLLGPKVLCREEMEGTAKEAKWHFIPTIEVSHWPDDAFEFFLRKRTVMRDRRTGLSYQVGSLTSAHVLQLFNRIKSFLSKSSA